MLRCLSTPGISRGSEERSMSTNNKDVKRLAMSIREAEHASGLSRATLYRLIASGRLMTLKIGARRLVTVGALDTLLNEGSK
jgi:excisionase family DNA binding protein